MSISISMSFDYFINSEEGSRYLSSISALTQRQGLSPWEEVKLGEMIRKVHLPYGIFSFSDAPDD